MLISQVNCLAMDNLNTIKSSTGVKLNTSINNVNRPKSLSEIINKKPLPMINFLKKKKISLSKGKFEIREIHTSNNIDLNNNIKILKLENLNI